MIIIVYHYKNYSTLINNQYNYYYLCYIWQVASIAMDADEDEVSVVNQENKTTDEGKSWADIIPETERKKLQEEEEQKKQLEMYLPPRNRKTVKKVLLFVSILFKELSQGILNYKFLLHTKLPENNKKD